MGPSGATDLRVGYGIEVRTNPRYADGTLVPQRKSGTTVLWSLAEGGSNVTLPWDENPWRRWLTAVNPGHYRIAVTLTLPDGERLAGELEGEAIP